MPDTPSVVCTECGRDAVVLERVKGSVFPEIHCAYCGSDMVGFGPAPPVVDYRGDAQ